MIAIRALIVLCLGLMVAACASQFRADVVRFHQLSGVSPGGTVLVRPEDEKRSESLEFNRYADLVGAALAKQGFAPPVAGQPSDCVAKIEWDALPTSTLKDNDGSSVGIGVGVGGGSHSGVGVGVSTGFSLGGGGDRTTYVRRLTLIITRTADNVRVFEGRAVSRGETADMMEVMPYLVEALFKDFPGNSGETISVQIPRK